MLISIVHKKKFVHWYAKFIYHHQTLACEKLEVTFNLQMFATNLIVWNLTYKKVFWHLKKRKGPMNIARFNLTALFSYSSFNQNFFAPKVGNWWKNFALLITKKCWVCVRGKNWSQWAIFGSQYTRRNETMFFHRKHINLIFELK